MSNVVSINGARDDSREMAASYIRDAMGNLAIYSAALSTSVIEVLTVASTTSLRCHQPPGHGSG